MSFLYEKMIVPIIDELKRRGGLVNVKTHTFYLPALDKNSIVVDLGANVGEFSHAVAKETGATCYAIEAVGSVFRQIPDSPGVSRHNIAISDRNGPLRIFLSSNREAHSCHSNVAEEYGLLGEEICVGMTLQSFLTQERIKKINLLKVDIEGAEEMLFNVTSDEELKIVDQITIEFHDFIPGSISSASVARIGKRLKSLGFYRVPFSYLHPQTNSDILFIRRDACNVKFSERACFAAARTLLHLERAKSFLRNRLFTPIPG